MADLVNNMKFDFVESWDCHSDVGVALIDHCTNITKTRLFSRYMDQRILSKCFLISPDAGALKSVYSIAKQIEVIDVIEASKKRDVTTGNITNTVVHADGDFKGQTALIVDDICDGGYTFIKLAEKLKEKGFEQVYLYVTHGIFSKGFEVFDNLIDRIYTTNSFEHKWEEKPDFVKVINR
jgi:ribose-phosphate pyrophosphokinase